jgi:hypothetical protein
MKGFVVRYGFDAQNRPCTAQHYENTRVTSESIFLYAAERHVRLNKVERAGVFVESVQLRNGRSVEWFVTGQGAFDLAIPKFDDAGRIIGIEREQVLARNPGKVLETEDTVTYDSAGNVASISRAGLGQTRMIFQAKGRSARKTGVTGQPTDVEQAAARIRAVLEKYLAAHPGRVPAAVAIAYDVEMARPAPPILGIVWSDEVNGLASGSSALIAALNPAEHDCFDIPELSLDKEGVAAMVPGSGVGQQDAFYVDVAKSLASQWPKEKARQPAFYATDLECNDLGKNLEKLGITKLE